jgi:gas vesicle protein
MMIGGLAGAVIALLYAPSSGEETRARMRGTAIELRDRATGPVQDTVSQAKSKAQELKENGLDKAAEMKQRAKTIADETLD